VQSDEDDFFDAAPAPTPAPVSLLNDVFELSTTDDDSSPEPSVKQEDHEGTLDSIFNFSSEQSSDDAHVGRSTASNTVPVLDFSELSPSDDKEEDDLRVPLPWTEITSSEEDDLRVPLCFQTSSTRAANVGRSKAIRVSDADGIQRYVVQFHRERCRVA
jgi:hypothetical protein